MSAQSKLGCDVPNSLAHSYRQALINQPKYELIDQKLANYLAYALFAAGQTLVLSSTWALGITGTFYEALLPFVTQLVRL